MNRRCEHKHSGASHLSCAGRALSSGHTVWAVVVGTCLESEDWGGQPDSKRLNSDCQWRMTVSIFNDLFSFKSTCQRTRPPHLYPAMGLQWLGGTLSWVGWLFIMMCSRSFCLTRGLATAPAGEEIRWWFASYAVTKSEPGSLADDS